MVVIGGTRHPDELQERGERIFPPQRLHYLMLPPAAERAVAEAAIRFKISTSISRRAHRCSSVSSLAGSFLLRPDGWTTRASSPPSRYRFTQSRICALLRTPCSRARALQSPSPRRQASTTRSLNSWGQRLFSLGLSIAPTPPWSILPLQSFTVDFVRPNSCCSMAMVAPSAYLSAKRCLNSAEQSLLSKSNPLTQKTPIGEAEHCLSNYRGSLHPVKITNRGWRIWSPKRAYNFPYILTCYRSPV